MKYTIKVQGNQAVIKLFNVYTSISFTVSELTPETVHGLMCQYGKQIEDIFGSEGLACLMHVHYHVCQATEQYEERIVA